MRTQKTQHTKTVRRTGWKLKRRKRYVLSHLAKSTMLLGTLGRVLDIFWQVFVSAKRAKRAARMFTSVVVCTHRAGALKRRVLLLSTPELAIGLCESSVRIIVLRPRLYLRQCNVVHHFYVGGKLNSAEIINKTCVARRVRISARYNFFVSAIKSLTLLLCYYRWIPTLVFSAAL